MALDGLHRLMLSLSCQRMHVAMPYHDPAENRLTICHSRRFNAEHAVLVLGQSKAGKSTLMNALSRVPLYVATPTNMTGGPPGRIIPALAALGNAISGSTIGKKDAESETLVVHPCAVETGDKEVPHLVLLDTPGLYDSRGSLI